MKKGFTLLEVMIAIFLVTVGIVGVFALINKSAVQMGASPNSLIAAYLAQEGIEIVRNIRDTNWIETPTVFWDDGLTLGNNSADYNDLFLTPIPRGVAPPYLNTDTNGYYSYDVANNPTIFRRNIIISKIPLAGSEYALKVLVDVSWTEKGKINNVKVEDHLYNWH